MIRISQVKVLIHCPSDVDKIKPAMGAKIKNVSLSIITKSTLFGHCNQGDCLNFCSESWSGSDEGNYEISYKNTACIRCEIVQIHATIGKGMLQEFGKYRENYGDKK